MVIGTAKTLALGRTAGDVVVVLAPVADDDLASAQARELLDVERFVADAPVERLDVGVLPGGAGVDVAPSRPPGKRHESWSGCAVGSLLWSQRMCAGAPRAATTPFEHGDRLIAGDAALDVHRERLAVLVTTLSSRSMVPSAV